MGFQGAEAFKGPAGNHVDKGGLSSWDMTGLDMGCQGRCSFWHSNFFVCGSRKDTGRSFYWMGDQYEVITERSVEVAGSSWNHSFYGDYFKVCIPVWLCAYRVYGADTGERQLCSWDSRHWEEPFVEEDEIVAKTIQGFQPMIRMDH